MYQATTSCSSWGGRWVYRESWGFADSQTAQYRQFSNFSLDPFFLKNKNQEADGLGRGGRPVLGILFQDALLSSCFFPLKILSKRLLYLLGERYWLLMKLNFSTFLNHPSSQELKVVYMLILVFLRGKSVEGGDFWVEKHVEKNADPPCPISVSHGCFWSWSWSLVLGKLQPTVCKKELDSHLFLPPSSVGCPD